jgi:alkanesulfonate monooxygenase
MQFFWFLPTHGDGRYLGRPERRRSAFPYFLSIAQRLDNLGYDGVLIPTGPLFEEPWTYAAALASRTRRLKYLVALQPHILSPLNAARQIISSDRISKGRILLNIVVGADREELAKEGISLSGAQRYEQAAEFLNVYQALFANTTVDFVGKYYQFKDARLHFKPYRALSPPLYSAGTSEAGLNFAARYADWYIMWADPVDIVARRIQDLRERARHEGRRLRFGIRVHFVVRETANQAWSEAKRLISKITEEEVRSAIRRFENEEAQAQRVSFALHRGKLEQLEIAPNLWAGVSLARGGALTAIVGDAKTVKARLREYSEAGIELIIGSGTPHLEEAETVHEFLRLP